MSLSPRQNRKLNLRSADEEEDTVHHDTGLESEPGRSDDNPSHFARGKRYFCHFFLPGNIINRVPFPSQKCLIRTINYLVTGNIRNKLPFFPKDKLNALWVRSKPPQWSGLPRWATCGYQSHSRPSMRAWQES